MNPFVVHISNQIKSTASPALLEAIEKKRENYKKNSFSELLQLLNNDAFLKDKLFKSRFDHFNVRVIVQLLEFKGYYVICFYSFYKKGAKYDKVKEEIVKDPELWIRDNTLSQEDIEKINELIQKEESKKIKPVLPDELKLLKSEYKRYVADKWILESEKWQRYPGYFKDNWKTFQEIIISTLQNDNHGITIHSNEVGKTLVFEAIKGKCKVNYIDFSEDKVRYKFLISHGFGNNEEDQSTIEKYVKELLNHKEEISVEGIKRKTFRAYPDFFLSDDDLWFELQASENHTGAFNVSNLVLSGEEEEILENARFPMFISGNAGSGKTTVLWYLLCPILEISNQARINQQNPIRVLYLTYNQRLLKNAKEAVEKILTKNPAFMTMKDPQVRRILDESMWTFTDFLESKVLTDDVKSRYQSQKRITLSRFINLYQQKCQLPEKKGILPELAWHVIRTYIKGQGVDDEFNIKPTMNDVEEKDYDKVLHVYQHWYKHLSDDGWWDDIDLTRHAMSVLRQKRQNFSTNPEEESLNYHYIFCDEAQDFNRLEMSMLLELSAYTLYNVAGFDKLPLVMAGDSLQTINPTGFNWKRIKADFYTAMENRQFKVSPECFDGKRNFLKHNYRSSKEIVRFANTILFVRQHLFRDREEHAIQQQVPYRTEESGTPLKYILNENFDPQEFNNLINTILLVYPEEENLNNFINKDHDLINSNLKESNILTTSDAKGSEFDNVIVYKMGDYFFRTFKRSLEEYLRSGLTYDIRLSYFFSNLYVAVTRARKNLFIIDTIQGDRSFWQYFTISKADYLENLIQTIPQWNQHCCFMRWGSKIEKQNMFTSDPLYLAQIFEKDGILKERADILFRARDFYYRASEDKKALRCEALAFEFNHQFEEAGNIWHRLSEHDKAIECYWKGRVYGKVVELFTAFSIKKDFYRYDVSVFMTEHEPSRKFDLLDKVLIHDQQFRPEEEVWHDVLSEIKTVARRYIEQVPVNLAYKLKNIYEQGFREESFGDLIAEIFYHQKKWEPACELWDNINSTRPYFDWARYNNTQLHPEERLTFLLRLNPNEEKYFSSCSQQTRIEELLSLIHEDHRRDCYEEIGSHFYRAKDYSMAVEYWDKAELWNYDEYKRARYEITVDFNEKFNWLLSLENKSEIDKEKILEMWGLTSQKNNLIQSLYQSSGIPLFKNNPGNLIHILKKAEKYSDVREILRNSPKLTDWVELIEFNKNEPGKQKDIYIIAEKIAALNYNYNEMDRFLENEFSTKKKERDILAKALQDELNLYINIRDKTNTLHNLSRYAIIHLAYSYEITDKNPLFVLLLHAYEHLIYEREVSAEMKRWAQVHWLQVKERKLQHDINNKNQIDPPSNQEREKEEIEQFKKEWNITDTDIEIYNKNFHELNWKDYLNLLCSIIENEYSNQTLLIKKIKRLLDQQDIDLIEDDWDNIRDKEFADIKDERTEYYIERIDLMIKKMRMDKK